MRDRAGSCLGLRVFGCVGFGGLRVQGFSGFRDLGGLRRWDESRAGRTEDRLEKD